MTKEYKKMSEEEIEIMVERWKAEKKPSKIAASFLKVSDLQHFHLKHFKGAHYLWKPMNGDIWAGMLMDDSIDYVHLVLASKDVVMFLLDNDKLVQQLSDNEKK
jgi:hypothetical protein